MDGGATEYLGSVQEMCRVAATGEMTALREAAEIIADALKQGKRWWVFGTGHSHTLMEELWGRAGGLLAVHPIIEPDLMLHEGLVKSSLMERLPGRAAIIAETNGLSVGDVILLISNSGRNAVPVELAEICREGNLRVIALTSLAHSRGVTSRASSGKKLYELAEVVIDNHGVPGDAVVPRSKGPSVGATSTVVGAMLLQALSAEVIRLLDESAIPAEVYESANA